MFIVVLAHTNASRRHPPLHIAFLQQGQRSPGQVNIIYFQTFDQATIVNVSFQPSQARQLNPFNCSVSKISTRYSIILINILFLWYIEAYFHTITVETCFKTVHFQKNLFFTTFWHVPLWHQSESASWHQCVNRDVLHPDLYRLARTLLLFRVGDANLRGPRRR